MKEAEKINFLYTENLNSSDNSIDVKKECEILKVLCEGNDLPLSLIAQLVKVTNTNATPKKSLNQIDNILKSYLLTKGEL
ncbi:hypothetical protein COJ21_09840 [Priestia megaterium]|uniref:hypothetical protein n=1 Tax=Priestia megaterium TaxID=1404 RepID=UPI000BF8E7B6|nr:hypothetical protein [Priestia megaterium]PFK77412.1 hypothetical protein COJ21_09840 [Priestia megaterium]